MSEEQARSAEVVRKLAVAKEKKDVGDVAFKAGDVKNALRSYHEALMYLKGIDKQALSPVTAMTGSVVDGAAAAKPKTEADEMLEKIYSNMCACHLKQNNWKRAVETADKAISQNENNYKALFRKAKALGELGFFEKAEKILRTCYRRTQQEREKVHNQKFKGAFYHFGRA
ncbi:hypothetical protein B0H21DRAFT_753811, partial [Amylocystis lapponica]